MPVLWFIYDNSVIWVFLIYALIFRYFKLQQIILILSLQLRADHRRTPDNSIEFFMLSSHRQVSSSRYTTRPLAVIGHVYSRDLFFNYYTIRLRKHEDLAHAVMAIHKMPQFIYNGNDDKLVNNNKNHRRGLTRKQERSDTRPSLSRTHHPRPTGQRWHHPWHKRQATRTAEKKFI